MFDDLIYSHKSESWYLDLEHTIYRGTIHSYMGVGMTIITTSIAVYDEYNAATLTDGTLSYCYNSSSHDTMVASVSSRCASLPSKKELLVYKLTNNTESFPKAAGTIFHFVHALVSCRHHKEKICEIILSDRFKELTPLV